MRRATISFIRSLRIGVAVHTSNNCAMQRSGGRPYRYRGHSSAASHRSSTPRVWPNYFLAVPLAHFNAVTEHIKRIQAALVEGHPELEGTLVDPATAHLTLFVLPLHDPTTAKSDPPKNVALLPDAVQALESSLPLLESHGLKHPLTLTFNGLGNFNDQVLFLEVEESSGLTDLQKMADYLCSSFLEQNILTDQPQNPFKAHLTIAKTSQLNRRGSRNNVGFI